MKILIAGGTGFIGRHGAQTLKAKGHQVSVLSHSGRKSGQFEVVAGDVTNPETLKSISWDYDALIICVQFPNHPVENPKKGWTYEKVDAQGTENICKALLNTKSRIKKLVYVSGAGVDPTKTEPWFRAKIRAESAITATAASLNAQYVIFRPSWIYGPGDHSMQRFINFGKYLPVMPVIGDGKNKIAPLFVEDFAMCLAESVERPEVANQIIEIGGPEVLTMNQVQLAVLKHLGKSRPLVHQPIGFMKAMGTLASLLPTPPLSKEAIDFIVMSSDVDSKRAERLFGFRFKTLLEGLAKYQ